MLCTAQKLFKRPGGFFGPPKMFRILSGGVLTRKTTIDIAKSSLDRKKQYVHLPWSLASTGLDL
jgi:hypothetical protein